MTQGTGAWEIRTVWTATAHRPMEEAQVRAEHQTPDGARAEGRQLACCAGTRLIEIIRPNGQVASTYSRSDNRWRDYPQDTSEEELQRALAVQGEER